MNNEFVLEAIRKKLVGKTLSAREIYAVMDEIAHNRLGPIFTTYFAAAGFSHGFCQDELYYLTKAMADTGEKIKFSGVVADKHSTGGVAGGRTTMVLVPIIAACGIKIPKASSRAITSPAGTADCMEVLAPVTFTVLKIKKIVEEIGGCIVWGGGLNLAPADDILIQVERPLAFESFDKIIISIMAKKVACGATHIVLDIPVGPTMKIAHYDDAEIIAKKFLNLAKRFKIKIALDINYTTQPNGNGLGPVLEAKDAMLILEQKENRPLSFEKKALRLAGRLLDLCLIEGDSVSETTKRLYKEAGKDGEEMARRILKGGEGLLKMREIIKAQGGDPDISSEKLEVGSKTFEVRSERKGKIMAINNKALNFLCRILGAPEDKKAGIYLRKKIDDLVTKKDILYIMYSSDSWRLNEAKETLKGMEGYRVE